MGSEYALFIICIYQGKSTDFKSVVLIKKQRKGELATSIHFFSMYICAM